MKLHGLIALFAAVSLAQEAPKPACRKATNGQFWPAEANSSAEAVRRLTQSGELEMCTYGAWKYHWQRVSVNVKDLAKEKAAPSSKTPKQ